MCVDDPSFLGSSTTQIMFLSYVLICHFLCPKIIKANRETLQLHTSPKTIICIIYSLHPEYYPACHF